MKKFILFAVALIFVLFWIPVKASTDKSACNLYGHSSPSTPFPSWWCIFWDEHIDWQTSGKTNYYSCATRNQPVGTYELSQIWYSAYLPWLYAFFDSNNVHRDSGVAHLKVNCYYYPRLEAVGTSRLVPGWDPVNDVNGDWQRDKEADYDYNNASTYFTVSYSPDYIEDVGGGRMGAWTANEWQRDYVKMGWGGDADTTAFRVDSNTTTRLYLNSDIPSHTYTWFIVDDSSAINHNAVAMVDSLARLITTEWTPHNLINIKHWLARAFAGRFFHNMIHTALLGREPTDIYPDDVPKTNPAYSSGSGWTEHWTMTGTCLEGLDNDDIYRPNVREYFRQIKDSLGTGNFLLTNVYEVHVGYDSITYNHAFSGLWHETWLDPGQTARADFNIKLNTIKKYKNSPYNYNLQFLHASGSDPIGDLSRCKMNIYSQYLIQYSDSFYLLYDTEPWYGTGLGDTTKWWFGLMSINLGIPSDTGIEVLENSQYVWKRSFVNGYIIWKPRPSSGSNYTDATTHTLPKYYYRLDVNGNITGDSVNQVSLRNAEGVVFKSTTETIDSLIQTKWKIDTTTTSFSIRDSIYTLFSFYADSVVLRTDTDNNIAGSTRKYQFADDNVDTLIASDLSENTMYYFWCIVWDTGRADTTVVDSVTTKSETPPPAQGGHKWRIKIRK
jgi:hypothetical protein